ncbi:MAG: hypothetical protein KAR79_06195, partial [Simkaniaceae bacterium]|nr:hypothetical protein [Simkaniaceae bacterium]
MAATPLSTSLTPSVNDDRGVEDLSQANLGRLEAIEAILANQELSARASTDRTQDLGRRVEDISSTCDAQIGGLGRLAEQIGGCRARAEELREKTTHELRGDQTRQRDLQTQSDAIERQTQFLADLQTRMNHLQQALETELTGSGTSSADIAVLRRGGTAAQMKMVEIFEKLEKKQNDLKELNEKLQAVDE